MSGIHSLSISTKNGPLAQIWLAANMSNLGRGQVLQTSIIESADEIAKASGCDDNVNNIEHITLRTSGELLQGIVRVYSKQAAFLLSDIKDTLTKISTLFKSNQRINVDANKANTIAAVDQLILEDAVTEKDVLAAPSLDFLYQDQVPVNLMGQKIEEKRQRRVQGAASSDISLELGRRFDPDEDLEKNQSSGLELDFDIEDGHLSRTAGEGIRQFQESEHTLMGGDDFPLRDSNGQYWDLGVADGKYQNRGTSEVDSVEIGRKAEERSVTGEPIDFGFNLDLEKDAGDKSQDDGDNDSVRKRKRRGEEEEEARESRARRGTKLRDCRRIQRDVETELDDHELRMISQEILGEQETGVQETPRWNQKRLWGETIECLSYLPQDVVERLSTLQVFKKSKTQVEMENKEIYKEPQMDISLGLNDDLIPNSSMGSSHSSSEHGDAGHESVEADIDISYSDDVHERYLFREHSTQQDSNGRRSLPPGTEESKKVKLTTGEFVSKETVDLAELMRIEFVDNNPLEFTTLLQTKKKIQGNGKIGHLTREEATRGFFDVLSLATADCIDLDQCETFGKITISAKPALYGSFLSA